MASRKKSHIANPIDVVEAAYELGSDDRTWLREITRAIRPLLDGGHGVTGYTFDLAVPMADWLHDEITFDISPAYLEIQREFQLCNSPGPAEAMHEYPEPLDALLEATMRVGFGDLHDDPNVMSCFRRMGVRDYVAFRTVEPEGKGICISAGQDELRHIDRRTKRLWARVAAHIAAARRLRASLATVPAREATIEAVLAPSGKLEHAEGAGKSASAREALREAVARQERARGRMRREDPVTATEAWTALVSGRWSLVDQYERNGRRYIVAHRNAHALPDPRALTPRERAVLHLVALGKSNKLIAYELGLSTSTIATYLAQTMRKLGVSSRVELVQLAHQLGAGAPE